MEVAKYINIVEYEPNIMHAVEKLQTHVFETGAYRTYFDENDYKHSDLKHNDLKNNESEQKKQLISIDDARNHAGERGTASILDVYGIRDELHFACLSPLNDAESLAYFDTDRLTVDDLDTIRANTDFWESMGRGEARYVVLFDTAGNEGKPVQYLIAGLAFG